jgi:hypothetical protein
MADGEPTTNTVFTPFSSDDIVTGVPNRITDALWSNNMGILVTMSVAAPSASLVSNINKYYIDVYGSENTGSAQVEFSIAYGHVSGSGSGVADTDKPTKAIYGQYRNLLLDSARGRFALQISSSYYLNDFIAIDIKRANLRQKLDAGNWELHIANPGTVSSSILSLVDNSGDQNDINVTNIGRVLSVVSGTISGGPITNSKEYGLCYPDYGIILLAPSLVLSSSVFALDGEDPFEYSVAVNAYSDNHQKFYAAVSRSHYFAARSEEDISSTHYFVRAKNKYYNYSTNPSFYSASDGTLIYSDFATNPKVFITTIGLYNNNNELLAVGKLSQPVQKGFDKEALFKVRLDF